LIVVALRVFVGYVNLSSNNYLVKKTPFLRNVWLLRIRAGASGSEASSAFTFSLYGLDVSHVT